MLDYKATCLQTERKAKLQNTVMQVLLKIRADREKPSIADLFHMFKKNHFTVESIEAYVKNMYSKTPEMI